MGLFQSILAAVIILGVLSPCIMNVAVAGEGQLLQHNLSVRLDPAAHRIEAEDAVTLPSGNSSTVRFALHKGLTIRSLPDGVVIVPENDSPESLFRYYKASLTAGMRSFALRYGGSIYHPVKATGREQARGYQDTPGIIDAEGVYLANSSFWYPVFEGAMFTFIIKTDLPAGWDAVSQGERKEHQKTSEATTVTWTSPEPQDEIYLIAGKFAEYSRPAAQIQAMAFLRTPDKVLADRYLEATERYIKMYEQLIGAYPYKKFALVENFWDTGFGMPSFTLLGPNVIRLPFIVNSSYPHEILHNYWGNSVFPDYAKGNWSEGLTAYLSDFLIREQQGTGTEYRQSTLQKYADYVITGKDFPLSDFRSRHSTSSEAVGYGKSLMFFHMLRRDLGDTTFARGIRDFYQENKFRLASFDDLRKSFEKTSGRPLSSLFSQWVARPGAPQLVLREASAKQDGIGYVITASLEQIQEGEAFVLNVPVAVTLKGQGQAYQAVVSMDAKKLEASIRVPSQPLRIDIDPEFDLFRKLERRETPPAISQALGSRKMLILLPSRVDAKTLAVYQSLASALSNSGPDAVEIKLDSEVATLPPDSAVAVLGWENRFAENILSGLEPYDVLIGKDNVRISRTVLTRENHSFVFTARNPGNADSALLFIGTNVPGAMAGLGRKLPHYHKYSYLAFEGDEPSNVAKGRWPVDDSPMTAFIADEEGRIQKTAQAGLAARKPLVELPRVFSSEGMINTIRALSGDDMQGRGVGTPGLHRAADFIAAKFREAGLNPAGSQAEGYFQEWRDPEYALPLKNVIGVVPGRNPAFSGQSVIIGAHYDSLGRGNDTASQENKGRIHPGADDNASGVAVLLELARLLGKDFSPERSIVFIAFTGEESGRKGSRNYIALQKDYPADSAIGMLNLDTVGRLGRNKLLVLGAGSSREWVHIFRGAGFVTGVEIETVSEMLDSSDQMSFQEKGIPAVQLFTGPHLDYHRPTDTAEKIDAEGLVKVASVAKEVIEYLAGRPEPLTPSGQTVDITPGSSTKERKVSLGIIPDYTAVKGGCRISGVVPGSPAESCGLQQGDIITRIDGTAVNSLKDLSDILKKLAPGSRVTITFLREGREMTVQTDIKAR